MVSDFAYLGNGNTPAEFQQRVYARPNAVHGAPLALQAGIDILKAMENWLGVPFSLPKLDQAAIPDFAAGAMENWGLVTYREPYLLMFDYNTYTTKTNIVTVIAHEYAHQWFGNLVTPMWWTYLWLNEGFATLFEHYATDWVYPEWGILDVFVYNTVQYVFQPDAGANPRPMTYYVESNNAIDNLFDSVAYDKSGSVLRMFLHAFSEESFKKGLNIYLNRMQYQAAVEEDLFAALEVSVKEDQTLDASLSVQEIMYTWTRQRGFPVLHVTRNYNTGSVNLRQERYFTNQPASVDQSAWWIPYNFATPSSYDFNRTTPDGWLAASERTKDITVSGLQNNQWLLVNKKQTGYYRVKYDDENYLMLANEMNAGDYQRIHLASRSSLIDDTFEFARRERLNYTIVFSIIKHLRHDNEYVPWASAFSGLTYVDRLNAGSVNHTDYANFIIRLVTNLYTSVGIEDIEDEPQFRKTARISAVNWACRMGLQSCLEETNAKLMNYFRNGQVIHQNNQVAIYCAGMRRVEEADYVMVMNRLRTENDQSERNRLISAMACATDRALLFAYMQTAVSSQESEIGFRSNAERYRVFNDVAGNGVVGASVAIQFLMENFDDANRYFGSNNLNNGITRLATFVVSTQLREDFAELIEVARTKTYITANTLNRSPEVVLENYRWIDRNQRDIENWIHEHGGSSSVTVSSIVIAVILLISRFL